MPPEINTTGIQHYTIPSFTLTSGTTLPITVAYRSFNPSGRKTVLIPTCYGGRINDTQNFTSGALKDHHVIVAAMLGNGESSSPSNTPSFPFPPSLRYQDVINAHYALLTQHLGIKQLDAVIGFSMGGQQAYYWATMHGSNPNAAENFVRSVVVICGSAKTSGHNFVMLEGPTTALEASIDYDGGSYVAKGVKPVKGLQAFGRAYAAWLTSAEWFRQELWRNLGAKSLEEWLPGKDGGRYNTWDARDLLVLARMWQAGDVGAVGGDGDWQAALRGITARVMLMPSRTDQYFTAGLSEMELEYLKNGVWAPIETIWGHIAGGGANPEDLKWMDGKIAEFLTENDVLIGVTNLKL
ncbi:homoserine acetyltransferase family protein [Xylogone sp. PMI_703]|nr:homoserine acetyltransferase family protein [Xylogone sp. PMI_703]